MISILVAYTKNNRVIGNNGKIPWNLPSERDRLKKICNKKFILMGRKSFEEIGKGLPYCTIIVISKTLKTVPAGCLLAHSLEEAIKIASSKEVLVAGGEEIYKQALELQDTKKIYATEIYADFEGDRHFPQLEGKWTKTSESAKIECGIKYEYVTYKKE